MFKWCILLADRT